jgi:xanthine dehydrogenase small subunit
MRGAADSMKVLRPQNPREAARLYAENPKAIPLAGGTDFMVGWNMGLFNDQTILDLAKLTSWTKIKRNKTSITIGALCTHAQLRDSPIITKELPLLAAACATVGGEQIQNRGTLGGNLANASPAGDTFPALAVYRPQIHTVAARFRRTLTLSELFAGVKRTHLRSGELIESIEIPLLKPKPQRGSFRKVGTRAAQAISKTMAAGLLWRKRDGTVKELRFALGSVAPTVKRLATVEDYIAGKKLTPKVLEKAVSLVTRDISPIDDIRSTRNYRLTVSRNLLRQFLKS